MPIISGGGGGGGAQTIAQVLTTGSNAAGHGVTALGSSTVASTANAVPLKIDGVVDQTAYLFQIEDSVADGDNIVTVGGYKSGKFIALADFYRDEFFTAAAAASGRIGQITINSGLSDTLLTSRTAGTTLDLAHDNVLIGNGVGASLVRIDGDLEVNTAGLFRIARTSAPADATLAAGTLALWFDSTNGAAKLMVKAKTADGTVVTASIALA